VLRTKTGTEDRFAADYNCAFDNVIDGDANGVRSPPSHVTAMNGPQTDRERGLDEPPLPVLRRTVGVTRLAWRRDRPPKASGYCAR